MSYPQHPNTIVIRNEYYPGGIKEIDIWNYYQRYKNSVLKETMGRDLMFFIAVDLNQLVVLRKGRSTQFLRLTPRTYDTMITGRTISIHSTMFKAEDFGIIDIDTDNFDVAKTAAIDVYNTAKNFPFVDNIQIRFTGKTSFHIVLFFKRRLYIDMARLLIERELRSSRLADKYNIGYRRHKDVPNLDLSPNKHRGGFITLNSLSTMGLRCGVIDINNMHRFKKEDARIQTL